MPLQLLLRAAGLGLGVAAAAAAPLALAAPAPMIDLQYGVCTEPAPLQRALSLEPHGKPLEVWLFDNPALDLFGKGIRIRLRGAAKEAQHLTVKLAEQDCATLPPLPRGKGKCEFDLHGAHTSGSLSIERNLPAGDADKLLGGRMPLADALGKAQHTALRDIARVWPLPADLRALGPTRVSALRSPDGRYQVDISELPGGQRFIEISRKVALADAEPERARFEADLAKAGVTLCADQSAQAVNKLRALLAR